MAESKYNLLLKPTKNDERVIYKQPWYKERLRTHYMKSVNRKDPSQFFNCKDWTYLKDGLDDFRDGLPPAVQGSDLIRNPKGLDPNFRGSGSADSLRMIKQAAQPHRFTKDQVCFSRVTPQAYSKRMHIEEIEYGLKQHPLALYPHLEEALPPEVFEDVVDILDPEMNFLSDDEDSYIDDEEEDSQSKKSSTAEERTGSGGSEGAEQPIKNPYRWLPRKEEKDKKDKKKSERRSMSPSQDAHINKVTKEFTDWVASLGGESNNIEESTIMSLFASGYETKPALSVPIHVVELTNVPQELRMNATVPPPAAETQSNIPSREDSKPAWNYSGGYQPSWAKFKYGAWYLSPKSWKKQPADEPLRNPKELKDEQTSEAKKKSQSLDSELAPMHGAKAFMEFIDSKNVRRPEFLNNVRQIQEEAAQEEARLEVEQAAKWKLQDGPMQSIKE